MASIITDTDELRRGADSLIQIKKKMGSVSSALASINLRSFMEIKASPALMKKISTNITEIDNSVRVINQMSSTLTTIAKTYDKTEKDLCGSFNAKGKIGEAKGGNTKGGSDPIGMPHWKAKGSVVSREKGVTGELFGIAGGITATGSLLDGSVDVSPTKIAAEGHLAKGTVTSSIGLEKDTLTVSAGNVSAKGEVKGQLWYKGEFKPQLQAKVKGEASALRGEYKGQFGTDNTNIHRKAEGALLYAGGAASAGVGVIEIEKNGKKTKTVGVEFDAKAEAALAKGAVSGGFTIMGIKIDASLEGSVGVLAEAKAHASAQCVKGKIGAGLGIGAGISISIDWSDFKLAW